MESTPHGVDISWLHHSKDGCLGKDSTVALRDKERGKENGTAAVNGHRDPGTNGTQEPKQNGGTPTKGSHNRPEFLSKSSEETVKSAPSVASPTSKDTRPRTPEPKRRGSWITNISSKFSSSSGQQTPVSSPAPATVSTPEVNEVTASASNGSHAISTPPSKDSKKPESPPAASPSKSGSFLQSALRRLSSSGGSSVGKVQGNGGLCPRRVMNVDPYRDRCQIDDLQPAKLRRVSFSVDVEIAPPAHYHEPEEESPPPSAGRRPSLTQLEKAAAAKKARETNVKMKEQAEGEALKHPEEIAEKKESVGSVEQTEAKIEPSPNPATDQEEKKDDVNGDHKKKKKPRTEAEKAERRERKRQAALANGSIPLEITRNSSSEDVSTPGTTSPAPKPNDKPTIDPLRIYRRCCQLRESPVLKRVADQLSSPNATDPNQPGVVTSIDLTGFKIPLTDTVTLGDWLAIVPVRKLMLEDCDLIDEAVRVVLAGLLAAKTPDQVRHNRYLAKGQATNGSRNERIGVIEKLSLKGNHRITRDGWAHISYFVNMSKSLKAIDISGITLPTNTTVTTPKQQHHHILHKHHPEPKPHINVAEVFEKSLSERIAHGRLEELVMGRCGLDTEMVESIIRGATACGVKRLGLAYNNLDSRGVEAVCNFLLARQCEGLDLGGNDLSEQIPRIVSALDSGEHPLYALSVADCGLTPHSLKPLLPVLVNLPHFKFIDLSHNHALFSTQPNATALLRKYLPQMHNLRRIHLNDVAMESEHCIALAEILPEIPYLAHIGISENPKLTALASAVDEALQEEACACYASIMVAVRVSKSIVSVEMEMPTQETSELVKALGKQILAYALRNMERGPAAEAIGAATGERHDSLVEVPDVLLHLVGQIDGFPEDHEGDDPAPSEDYIVSGTGIVKALGICLGNKASDRTPSRGLGDLDSGTSTPLQVNDENVDQFKAKDMSKNLLESARKIRHRLQAALAKESHGDSEMTYHRLQFLNSTLTRMIERFEEEYPEVCPHRKPEDAGSVGSSSVESDEHVAAAAAAAQHAFTHPFTEGNDAAGESAVADAAADDEDDPLQPHHHNTLARHGSDASHAARSQAHEEGQMHRFGQQVRRSLLAPHTFDYHHRSTSDNEQEHLQILRARLEATPGAVIQAEVARYGVDAVIRKMGCSAKELAWLQAQDPESFAKLRATQLNTAHNAGDRTAAAPPPPVEHEHEHDQAVDDDDDSSE